MIRITNKLAKYGFSAYSNSVQSYTNNFGVYERNGMVSNTGLVVSRYFEKQFAPRLLVNLQVGTALNVESTYFGASVLMLNLNVGAELKYEIFDNWFFIIKGLAVGQDIPNIVRYSAYGDSRVAGEDMHLISLFGVATNIGRK